MCNNGATEVGAIVFLKPLSETFVMTVHSSEPGDENVAKAVQVDSGLEVQIIDNVFSKISDPPKRLLISFVFRTRLSQLIPDITFASFKRLNPYIRANGGCL